MLYNYNDFFIVKKLGEGSFGNVYLCLYIGKKIGNNSTSGLQNRTFYVLKESTGVSFTLATLNYESKILEKIQDLKSNNIAKYYGTAFTLNHGTTVTKALVLEYVLGDDLYTHMKNRKVFHESIIIHILKQIAEALQVLKDNKITHRDIKLENVMYEPSSHMVKIVDFGLAKYNSNTTLNDNFKKFLGTEKYMPPELMNGKTSDTCDIWSLGIIAYYLLNSKEFNRIYSMRRLNKVYISQSIKDIECSESLKNLINKMVVDDAKNRIRHDDLVTELQQLQKSPPIPSQSLSYEEVLGRWKAKDSQKKAVKIQKLMLEEKNIKHTSKGEYEQHINTRFNRITKEGIFGGVIYHECFESGCEHIEELKFCQRCGLAVCDTHSKKLPLKLFKKHISTGTFPKMKEHYQNNEGKIKKTMFGYVSYNNPGIRVMDTIRVCNLCAKYAQEVPKTELFENLLGGKKKKTIKNKTYKKIVAGRKRVIHTGPKGGKYFIRNKRKVYIK